MASVKVAVRVRPFSQREIDMGAKLIIDVNEKTTGIFNCKANARDESIRYKEFTFDYSYWSFNDKSSNFASQEQVYKDLGTEVVECAFEGYNACVFAYGQTGSGKTFTMMGSEDNQGLIPRICKALFDKMNENSKKGTTHRVQVSYLEIYQERVADLLRGRDNSSLKVREHPKKGPYVQGLTTCLVTNYQHIEECMKRGNSHRTTAATNMNDVSSRSHAIFTITFVQAGYCDGVPSETVSKIHLVDLAGSERADATGATGQRLKEGGHINKSLVTLGSVISALAELSESNGQRKSFFIPYRDSVLTWLLKDSLGGNSKTIMIAAISPADCNYGETLSTLRYANRAKNIINKPTVNEDPNVKLIRELRNEISKLKALMFSEHRSDMLAQLHEKEAREKELTEEWAGKWREAQAILREQRALGLRKSGPGVVLDSDRPHLVAIDDDPLSTGVTLYHLKEGQTTIGTEDSDIKQDIELRGAGMEPQHCTIIFENGIATLIPHYGAHVMHNNILIDSPVRLSQGCIIFLGKAHVFRFNDPAEAAELRKGERPYNLSRLSLLSWSTPDLANSTENLYPNQDETIVDSETYRLIIEKNEYDDNSDNTQSVKEISFKTNDNLQTNQLQDDYRNLLSQQNQMEIDVKQKEIILKREELEKDRQNIMGQINNECENLQDLKHEILNKLNNVCQYISRHLNDFNFPLYYDKQKFQNILSMDNINKDDYNYCIDIINNIKGPMHFDNINKYRNDLSILQSQLDEKIELLTQRRKTIEELDKKLVNLVNEQVNLNKNFKDNEQLENLKIALSNRTNQELEKMEKRKQSLTLQLKKIHSVNNNNNSFDDNDYVTVEQSSAALSFNKNLLMCDSGVELRTSSRTQEDLKIDSQSTSSIENESHIIRKRNRNSEEQYKLNQLIIEQKKNILQSLDSPCLKHTLHKQISILHDLQERYMLLMSPGKRNMILSPANEHPLQDNNGNPSLSSDKSPHSGSTVSLNWPSLSQILSLNNNVLHRSMQSISTDLNSDQIVTITSYCVRGVGSKTHYEYEVKICTIDDRWTILRRYSRFRDLHLTMKAKYGDKITSIPFPSKQFFANSEAVAKSRKKQLEFYLKCLIETCKKHSSCPLAYGGPINKNALINFSPFFRKGLFENGKYGTS